MDIYIHPPQKYVLLLHLLGTSSAELREITLAMGLIIIQLLLYHIT